MLYMFFAEGFEETEAVASLDVIRRAGVEIQSVGVGSRSVTGAHGITVVCDRQVSEILPDSNLSGVVLPGGMPGTVNLEKSREVCAFIEHCAANSLLLCAICAAPSILGHMGLLRGKRAVCFPGFESELEGAQVADTLVCRDGNVITAKGMGCAVDFGLAVAAEFVGEKRAAKIRESLQCQ